jgi:hypothetical protein
MKRPDPTLPNLVPIKPSPSLTRWAIDYTFWEGIFIFVMVEYATGWIEAKFVASKAWPHTLPMLTKVQNRFGSSHELVNNNAPKFSGKIARNGTSSMIHVCFLLPRQGRVATVKLSNLMVF